MSRFTLIVLACSLLVAAQADPKNWPRPDSLVVFLPLQDYYGIEEVYNAAKIDVTGDPLERADINGPFGIPSTSYGIKQSPNFIAEYANLAISTQFTFSMYYYYSEHDGISGLAQFYQPPQFSIGYSGGNTLEITSWRKSKISIPNILKPNQWNFLAFTYDDVTRTLKLHDADGRVVFEKEFEVQIAEMSALSILSLGSHYSPDSAYWTMKQSDAMTCVMYYNTVLTPEEIAKLPVVCETGGEGTPAPKPTTTVEPTEAPKPTTPAIPKELPIPIKEALVAFWPLDAAHNTQDLSSNHLNPDVAEVPQYTYGPFGDEKTAVSPKAANQEIFTVTDSLISGARSNSLTVAMFFKRGISSPDQGGLFEFLDNKGYAKYTFQVRLENPTTFELGANAATIGHIQMIQPMGAWTFVAFVYEANAGSLTIYGRNGVILPTTPKPQLKKSMSFNNNGIRIGYASRWKQGLSTDDAVSCVSVYNAALTAAEVQQLILACRAAHDAAPCGTPRLFLDPIPASTKATAVPKPGQFPYIASLRSTTGGVICSASIIDPFWLITSSQCFLQSKEVANFKIFVGQHDIAVKEAVAVEHAVAKIILQGSAARDIALVQVAEPIDFKSQYVNDVCLFRGENPNDLKMDQTKFVFGWGKNGRPAAATTTSPRYIPGDKLTDDQCKTAWNGDYSAELDMCFSTAATSKDVPCSGDEGSPLLVQVLEKPTIAGSRDHLVQIGMYYKRDGSCSEAKPGLFVSTASFTKWIAEKIACSVPGVVYPDACPQ